MKKGVRSSGILSLLAHIATILAFLVSVSFLFFPSLGQSVSQGLTGTPQMTGSGDIRPEFIASQVNVLYWALGILVAFGGALFALLYDTWLVGKAQSVINQERPEYLGPVMAGLLALSLIIGCVVIPSQIFQLTSSSIQLQRQAPLLAWSARTVLGGLLLGAAVVVASAFFAVLIHLAFFRLPRRFQEKRLRRQLTRVQAQ